MSRLDGRNHAGTIFSLAEHARFAYSPDTSDKIVESIYLHSESIARRVINYREKPFHDWDRWLDDLLTSRIFGFPIMVLLLGAVFWITIEGANVPSEILAGILFWGQDQLTQLFLAIKAPSWINGLLVEGMYRCVAWVISVMLPPMAIFFPLFTFLEDLGYLPRVAFNMDRFFKKAGAHGKQSLTMTMGFGCNAAGIIACRIIDSPRERLIGILTNSFVPCNGRFPLLITLATILTGSFLGFHSGVGLAVGVVVGMVILGIVVTLLVSWLLSKTLFKGEPSSFALELPPYRKPMFFQILLRSIFDRTLFVLRRAIVVAAPAGAAIWLLVHVDINGVSALAHFAGLLQPFGMALGMDGYILTAFLLGLPANEIVLPILIMSYLGSDSMLKLDSLEELARLLGDHGWTWLTAVNVMLFSLLHFPCGTTLMTIWRETGSRRWTIIAALITTSIAMAVTFLVAQGARFLGLV